MAQLPITLYLWMVLENARPKSRKIDRFEVHETYDSEHSVNLLLPTDPAEDLRTHE